MKEGILEELLTERLKSEIDKLDFNKFYVQSADIDKAEASSFLSSHLKTIIRLVLNEIKPEDLEEKISLCNRILSFIESIQQVELTDDLICTEGKLVTGILERTGKTESQIQTFLKDNFPRTGLISSSLFTGNNTNLTLESELEKDILTSEKISLIVSFIRWSGIRIFEQALKRYTSRSGAHLRVLTTTYMGASERKALDFLSSLPNTSVKVSYNPEIQKLHAKAYIFERNTGFDTAYIGSSNLSRSAMVNGLEWNVRLTSIENPHIIEAAKATFETHWNSSEFEEYESIRFSEAIQNQKERKSNIIDIGRIHLHPFQKDVLDKLGIERKIHQSYRNLVVAATGTGKTVISAFDFKGFFDKDAVNTTLLFVAHRVEILEQARNTYRRVLENRKFGALWTGQHRPSSDDLRHLFISIQSFNSNRDEIKKILPSNFYTYIVIDEAHHLTADSYRPVIEYFEPKLLIGLTATPERMDGISLLPDFNHRIAAEIRLPEAMRLKLLSPFQYFCISDETVDLRNVKWINGKYDRKELTEILTNGERARLIIDAIKHYITDPFQCKALCFCASIEHAQSINNLLMSANLRSTVIVSNQKDSEQVRRSVRNKLRQNEINFVCVVDIFNEGVDIPEIDTVLFLRPTESLTVYLQQLGRGLRHSENKECLTVLDFVSQASEHYNFENKFRALIGKTQNRISSEIENGFPHLPPGCVIKMEERAQEIILNHIDNAVFNAKRIVREISQFSANTGKQISLYNFLEFFQLDLRSIYRRSSKHKCWTDYLIASTIMDTQPNNPVEMLLLNNLQNLIHVNSRDYLMVLKRISIGEMDDIEFVSKTMAFIDLFRDLPSNMGFDGIDTGLRNLQRYPTFQNEFKQLLEYLELNIEHQTLPFNSNAVSNLAIYGKYTREQILVACGKTHENNLSKSFEGVIPLKERNAEILLVTLNKSDKDFSPSTMYDDYAISETIFHWQSQNRVTPSSPTGLSYIQQVSQGKEILLFVRERTNDAFGLTMPYHFLGPVKYKDHKGSRPMSITWELKEPIPGYLWEAAAKSA
jgi:superfamily II DNA or RNA helicase